MMCLHISFVYRIRRGTAYSPLHYRYGGIFGYARSLRCNVTPIEPCFFARSWSLRRALYFILYRCPPGAETSQLFQDSTGLPGRDSRSGSSQPPRAQWVVPRVSDEKEAKIRWHKPAGGQARQQEEKGRW